MGYIGDNDSIMRPARGARKVYLPITFDYKGGRRESRKGKILLVIVLIVIGLIVGIGAMTSDEGFFIVNILIGLAIMYGFSLVIRFPVLGEHKIRNAMIEREESDYKVGFEDMWGIYSIDDVYPYYAHMRNGKTAIYILFEKDVILGKVEDSRYNHYEAIGDAINIIGSSDIGVCHADIMDIIGNDDRLEECFKSLPSIKNPDMRDLLTDIYTNLMGIMKERVTTYDIYVFTFRGSRDSFWYEVHKIINCLLDANYKSFKILNADFLRWMFKSMNNLHDFSVNDACNGSFEIENYRSIIPINVIHGDGTLDVINKTVEEKKQEAKMREKARTLEKEEAKNRKRNSKKFGRKNKKDKDDEFDLFDE